MSSIKQTVDSTLGFHGRTPDSVTASIVDALEIREAQIQADLLGLALQVGLDEDQVLSALHDVFQHADGDTEAPTLSVLLAQAVSTSRLLAEQIVVLSQVAV
jgi:hypothetical protein